MTTLFDVRRDERGPLLTAACGFFFVLSALMLLRPVRDAAGMAGEGLSHLMRRADQALYEAKRAGRNRVRSFSPHAVPPPAVAAG